MKRDDIRHCMLPAVVDDHWTVRVQSLGQMIDLLCKMLLSWVCFHLRDSPGFIKRRPDNDTGMTVILPYDLCPFPGKFFYPIVLKLIGRRHLAPHQKPFLIAPIQESLILCLLMFPQAVVPKSHDLIDILYESLFIWRGKMRLLPIALV